MSEGKGLFIFLFLCKVIRESSEKLMRGWFVIWMRQACACSNWGNLPTAVVQTVAQNAPFNKATDPTLGVAYVSVFILVVSIKVVLFTTAIDRC